MIVTKKFLGSLRKTGIPSTSAIKKIILKVASSVKYPKIKGEINILFVDDKIMRRVNKKFLKHDRTTDVIAFSYPPPIQKISNPPWGDILISVPVARRQARQYNVSFQNECTRYIVHGMLHLFGYKDKKAKDKKTMWKIQEKLVNQLC